MRIVYGVLVALSILTLSGFAFIHSGVYNVTATEEHSAVGKWALHTTMKNSVETRASDIHVPANLSSEDMIRQGARAYDQLCVACHLKPGQSETLLRQGLNPTPPALTEAGHFGPAEQFWVIKNGIKMTGMPAWGNTHEDRDLWELTAFVQALPELSEQQYASLIQTTAGTKTAEDGHNHDHGTMAGMMATDSSHGEPGHHDAEATPADDGHNHDHGGMNGMTAIAPASSHGEPGHHDNEADYVDDDQHHAEKQADAQQQAEEPEADDHYADGHTH